MRLSRARAARQHGATPVYVASQNGHLEVVKYLAERAPDTLAVAAAVRKRMGGARTHTAKAWAGLHAHVRARACGRGRAGVRRDGAMAPTEARRGGLPGPSVHSAHTHTRAWYRRPCVVRACASCVRGVLMQLWAAPASAAGACEAGGSVA